MNNDNYIPDWKTYDANQINDLYKRLDAAESLTHRQAEEISRLRIKCGPKEMIEGDYARLIQMEDEIAGLKHELKHIKVNRETWNNR